MTTANKPTLPDVAPLVHAYRALPGNAAGGNFHLVLDNKNVDDSHVQFCLDQARSAGDTAGVELGEALLEMSRTQRLKLGALVESAAANSAPRPRP